jgi:hypothetical protein
MTYTRQFPIVVEYQLLALPPLLLTKDLFTFAVS